MKIVAIHDTQGNFIASVVSPEEDSPPGALAAGPGEMMTEVEAREVRIDPLDEKEYQQLIEVMKNFRVDVKTEAKLVKKRGAD
jgi:hypothetical protein